MEKKKQMIEQDLTPNFLAGIHADLSKVEHMVHCGYDHEGEECCKTKSVYDGPGDRAPEGDIITTKIDIGIESLQKRSKINVYSHGQWEKP